MRSLLMFLLITIAAAGIAAAQSAALTAEDLRTIEGAKWSGTLTYLDYSSNKKTAIKSDLTVTRSANEAEAWRLAYEYPEEPKANKSVDAAITNEGRNFFGEDVVERTRLPNGTLRLVTTQRGSDNDKPALFRYTYLIAPKAFSIAKEVRVDGTEKFFERNTYSWTR